MTKDWSDTKEYFITYSLLINAAQHQGVATYQEIAQACGLPTAGSYMSNVLGHILGLISQNEIAHNRPMLSAIAVDVSGTPGKGFINWAKELGVMQADEDPAAFFAKVSSSIYEEWKIKYRLSKSKE